MKRFFLSAVFMPLCLTVLSAGIPPKPSVPVAVYDYADLFTTAQYSQLNQELVGFSDTTSTRIVVLTVSDLEGMSSSEYAYEVGEAWGVGGSHDNGVVLLLKPRTADSGGDVAISVGYGLEGAIPDAVCNRIIQNEMIPHLAKQEYYEGVCAGVTALIKRASGEYSERVESDDDFYEFMKAMAVLLIVFLVVYLLFHKSGGRGGSGGSHGGGPWIFPGGGFGSGSGSGGGGFSGGGFSGGGFSGGFGGGHFGGGGASGKFSVGLAEMPPGLFLRGASPNPRIGGGGASGKF